MWGVWCDAWWAEAELFTEDKCVLEYYLEGIGTRDQLSRNTLSRLSLMMGTYCNVVLLLLPLLLLHGSAWAGWWLESLAL